MTHRFYVNAPTHFEGLLQKELQALGCSDLQPSGAGFYFRSDMGQAFRVILWSRLANRVLLPLESRQVENPNGLYSMASEIPWEEHFRKGTSFMVEVPAMSKTFRQAGINHSQFAAQKVKDGIVDRLRGHWGQRPSVDTHEPGIRVHVSTHKDQVQISLDLGGGSLHARGYRPRSGPASLKENLAAALVMSCGWPNPEWNTFVDPLCGTGTLVLEAAMMAADMAPGLHSRNPMQDNWLQFPHDRWADELKEAQHRKMSYQGGHLFFGFDSDERSLGLAREAAEQLGLSSMIQFQKRDLRAWGSSEKEAFGGKMGLFLTNPPYGERMGTLPVLNRLYRELGHLLMGGFPGWKAGVFSSHSGLVQRIKLRAGETSDFKNGPLACRLYQFQVPEQVPEQSENPSILGLNDNETMLLNRLKKNQKQFASWKKKAQVVCYRHYDADMPEYNAAVDVYGDHVVVFEYAPPKSIPEAKAEKRRFELLNVVTEFFDIPEENIVFKMRQKQKGNAQYQKQGFVGTYVKIEESGVKLLFNFTDYLDTGIFLDHRPIRRKIKQLCRGKDFLNLFSYTGTATVFAIAGGARRTTSVDLSRTYQSWARKNIEANGYSMSGNRLVEQDVFEFLKADRSMYDLILLDPPSFSNSKKFQGTFDIQRDHVPLISLAMKRLRTNGKLFFSNNLRDFKIQDDVLKNMGFHFEDITKETLDPDFQRGRPVHSCYLFSWSEMETQWSDE